MSKMKDVYFSMMESTMNHLVCNLEDGEIVQRLHNEFGSFFAGCFDEVINQAKADLATFHNDMMHSAFSHEDYYGR